MIPVCILIGKNMVDWIVGFNSESTNIEDRSYIEIYLAIFSLRIQVTFYIYSSYHVKHVRKMRHGYQCHNLGIGTIRDHYQTTLWISKKSGRRRNKTRERYQEIAFVMKKTSSPPIKSNKIHHSQVLPLSSTTRTPTLQMLDN